MALVRGLGFKFGQTGSFGYCQGIDVLEQQLGRLDLVGVVRQGKDVWNRRRRTKLVCPPNLVKVRQEHLDGNSFCPGVDVGRGSLPMLYALYASVVLPMLNFDSLASA